MKWFRLIFSIVLLIVGSSMVLTSDSLSVSGSSPQGICPVGFYFDYASGSCMRVVSERLSCPDEYAVRTVTDKTRCAAEGGVWDECPQCPRGRVCSLSICQAECTISQYCYKDVSKAENDCDYVEPNGDCWLDSAGDDIFIGNLCGDETIKATYIYKADDCRVSSSIETYCPVGYKQFIFAQMAERCVIEPESYADCYDGKVWDDKMSMCVYATTAYEGGVGVVPCVGESCFESQSYFLPIIGLVIIIFGVALGVMSFR